MPIKFRCPSCHQFLGISRSKAGEISDCPMCGKTIRVPDLDGSVKPLPTPELNLEDSSLVDALGELAGIGRQADVETPVHSATGKVEVPLKRSVQEPISLEPLMPAPPIGVSGKQVAAQPLQGPQDMAASVSEKAGTVEDPDAELRAIAASHSATKQTARSRPNRARLRNHRSWIVHAVIAGGFLVVGFGLALLLAPARPPERSETITDGAGDEAAISHLEAAGGELDRVPAVTGRITYVTDSGDTRPDEGAKVLVLPEDRRGTAKLDVVGFLVGSTTADELIAAASLQALGGDVTTADDQGEYALNLDSPGSYQLLVISRHQSRTWEVGVNEVVQEQLARFFIRPSTLLGQLAYDMQDLKYRGQGTSSRDFAINRE